MFHNECIKNPFSVSLRLYSPTTQSDFLVDFSKAQPGSYVDVPIKALFNVDEFEVSKNQGINDEYSVSVYFSHRQLLTSAIVATFPTAISMLGNENKLHFIIDGYIYQTTLVTAEGRAFDDAVAIGLRGKLVYDA